MVGLDIWRKAVTPYLYNNSSTWLEMPKKAFSLLDSITHSFFRSLFSAAKGNPLVMYYWDTKSLLSMNLVMMNKLLLYHDLISLSDSSLANEILLLQSDLNTKDSFVGECESFMEELEIHEDPSSHSKHSWKRLVKALYN